MSEQQDAVLDAIVAVVPPLLNGLEALGFIARHLHPPRLSQLVEAGAEREAALRAALSEFRRVAWPEQLARFREVVEQTGDAALEAFGGLRDAVESPEGILPAYRALRHAVRAQETLYPVASMLPAVSRFYLEPKARDDKELLKRLAEADRSRQDIGVLHADEDKSARGSFSLYVPEDYDAAKPHPLVMAMHGGSGNGGAFLWSWLREARSRGAILISPTAIGSTWSLMDPEIDSANIERMLEYVRGRWNVDPEKLLLTGMSDGGTFSLVSGLRPSSPFTHLAPIAASFHPMLLALTQAERIGGLPIYLVHGALDWMFPIEMARNANAALSAAGAEVTFREIDDLSHTYPRDENSAILDWFLAA